MRTVTPPSGQLSWVDEEVGEKGRWGQKGEGRRAPLPCLWERKVLQKEEEGLVSLFWAEKEAENINPAHNPRMGGRGDRRSWWNRTQLSKNTTPFFWPPLTWSVEVLRWSGQRGGVAMATVHCINSKGAMACGFWNALPPIKAFLSKRDQGRVKKTCQKSLNFTSRPNIQCNLQCLSGIFTSVVCDTAPGD